MWKNVVAALTLTAASANAGAHPIEGVWTGTYVCAQGTTPLELFVTQGQGGESGALFHFGDGSSSLPEGCFAMAGSSSKGMLSLTATHWIKRPYGYVTINILGSVSGDTYAGLALGPGCTTFQLDWHPLVAAPAACVRAATPTS